MNKWESKKSDQKKEYRTALGQTDYNIPMFGYRSAFVVLGVPLVLMLATIAICNGAGIDYRIPALIIGALAVGLSLGYSQFFLERKKGFVRNFYLVSGIGTIVAGVFIYLIYFGY